MGDSRFIGIDFSGSADAWRNRHKAATVWLAIVEGGHLAELVSIQQLAGDTPPFDKLVDLLAAGRFRAAGIDAPLSLPARYVPAAGGHAQLLADVLALGPAADRPFPRGADLVELAKRNAALETTKPTRQTEDEWRRQGVNVRSTLWAGPRGGAAFTAASLMLLARAQCPIWPWKDAPGMLVEAFPAGQLRAWGLPHISYGPPSRPEHKTEAERRTRRDRRHAILKSVTARTGIQVSRTFEDTMTECTDALDAYLAVFGARAAANRTLRFEKPANWKTEGAIAVHA